MSLADKFQVQLLGSLEYLRPRDLALIAVVIRWDENPNWSQYFFAFCRWVFHLKARKNAAPIDLVIDVRETTTSQVLFLNHIFDFCNSEFVYHTGQIYYFIIFRALQAKLTFCLLWSDLESFLLHKSIYFCWLQTGID